MNDINNTTKHRNDIVDIVKGIGIILVVAGHLKWSPFYDVQLHNIIYSFHMPLFFILAGCFASHRTGDEGIFAFTRKKAIRLLIPYLSYFLLYLLYNLCFNEIKVLLTVYGNINTPPVFPAAKQVANALFMSNGKALSEAGINIALWFLPAIFIANVLFYFVTSMGIKSDLPVFLFLLGVGYWSLEATLYVGHNNIPWGIDIAAISLLFLYVGKFLKKIQFSVPQILFILIIILIPLSIHSRTDMQSMQIPNVFTFYLFGILGTVSVVAIAALLISTPLRKPLSLIGRSAFTIFALHALILSSVGAVFVRIVNANQAIQSSILVISAITISLMVEYYLFQKNAVLSFAFLGVKKDKYSLQAFKQHTY